MNMLLRRIREVWMASTACVDLVADASGVHSLRTYLSIHHRVGEPAVRKIARQLLKGVALTTMCSSIYGHTAPSFSLPSSVHN
jgi:hypothetical protein